jgi:hypothetical protein
MLEFGMEGAGAFVPRRRKLNSSAFRRGFLIGREGPRLKPLRCVAAIQGHECPCSLRIRAGANGFAAVGLGLEKQIPDGNGRPA